MWTGMCFALLGLRGRKTYRAIPLERKEKRCRKTGEGTEGGKFFKGNLREAGGYTYI